MKPHNVLIHDSLKSVRELLSEPDSWTQGVSARDGEGMICDIADPKAVCWCLGGAIELCEHRHGWPQSNILKAGHSFVWMNTFIFAKKQYHLTEWNDEKGRAHSDVLAILDEAINEIGATV